MISSVIFNARANAFFYELTSQFLLDIDNLWREAYENVKGDTPDVQKTLALQWMKNYIQSSEAESWDGEIYNSEELKNMFSLYRDALKIILEEHSGDMSNIDDLDYEKVILYAKRYIYTHLPLCDPEAHAHTACEYLLRRSILSNNLPQHLRMLCERVICTGNIVTAPTSVNVSTEKKKSLQSSSGGSSKRQGKKISKQLDISDKEDVETKNPSISKEEALQNTFQNFDELLAGL